MSASEDDTPLGKRRLTPKPTRVMPTRGKTKTAQVTRPQETVPVVSPSMTGKRKVIAESSGSESDQPLAAMANGSRRRVNGATPKWTKDDSKASGAAVKKIKKDNPNSVGLTGTANVPRSSRDGPESDSTVDVEDKSVSRLRVDLDDSADAKGVMDVAEDAGSGSDSDVPLARRVRDKARPSMSAKAKKPVASTSMTVPKRKRVIESESEEEESAAKAESSGSESEYVDDDGPSKQTARRIATKTVQPPKKKLAKVEQPRDTGKGRQKAVVEEKHEQPSKNKGKIKVETELAPKGKVKTKAAGGKPTKGKGKKKVEDDEQNEEDYKWWVEQNANNDDSVKWATLEHNGVLFPPPYEPHGVKMKFNGKEVHLEPEAEEIATFFAACVGTEHVKNDTFCRNFFIDWVEVLKKSKKNPPISDYDRDFPKCDFTQIVEHLEREKERKKSMTKEQKQALKEEKQKLEEKYGYCYLDGRKEKVGNFRIEPPNLFRGRGAHPKTGKLKKRVMPEQVTINIGKSSRVPEPPSGHRWGSVIHNNTVTWLATWKENVNENIKYVFLAANSSLKGQSDLKKFEKARELKLHVDRIRADYERNMKDRVMATRQRATAVYLVDRLALRAGNEKDTSEEADTAGCCTLRVEHVTLEPPNWVTFDFLGKDSIRYHNTVQVADQVFKNLRLFKKGKDDDDPLFDRLSTQLLNKSLGDYMKGLTAKVFRTYNASYTFQKELKERTPNDSVLHEKVLAYNRANREVAVLCNHQRSVSKAHDGQMSRMRDKLRSLKYQKKKIKQTILTLDPKLKKKRPELVQEESDLEDNWIEEYEKMLMDKEREKIKNKFEKENEELKTDKKKPKSEKDLKALLREVDEKEKQLIKERKSGKVEPKRGATVEKLDAQLLKLEDRIKATKIMMVDKDENKQTALGTSKINYIDPRISVAWCKKHDVSLDKIFNKSLREKFKWAMDIDADWEF